MLGDHWLLIGGQMVLLHEVERHASEIRPTDDIDVAADLPARPPGAGATHDAIWYVTSHEPGNSFVEMLKITPGVTACRLTIQLRAAAPGSEAEITYTHTSLGPEGDRFVAGFTAEHYDEFMREWETRLNHFLATGTCLRGEVGG